MSDGGGGAPGGASPAGGATGTAPAAVTPIPKPAAKAPDKAKKPAEGAEPEWGDADEEAVSKLLKRAPWAKVKANGEEKSISSREEFLSLATDASRGRGAIKLSEQAKKEQAEAKAAKEEHAAHKTLLERARKGDQKALRELGLVPDTERAALEKQWNEMSPEQQDVYRRNHELETRLAEVEAKEKKDAETAAETKKKANRDAAMASAREHAKVILKDVKAELYDVELPEIIGAMHELLKTSQRIGRDYTPEQLALYVQQRRTAALDSRVGAMKPEAALKLALPHLKALVGTPEGLAQLEEVLGVDFELVAGKLSGRRLEKWKAAQQKKALGGDVKKPGPREDEPKPAPLPHFRF